MKKISSLRVARAESFAYTPPDSIYGTERALLVVDKTSPALLAEVLRGFWRLAPATRLLVTANESLQETMLGANMRMVDLDALPRRPFLSRVDHKRFINAPPLLMDVNASVTLTTVNEAPAVPPSLGVLVGLSPVPIDVRDAYFAMGHLFAGAVVQVGDQVIWGDDLLDVDAAVYRALNIEADPVLQEIRAARKALDKRLEEQRAQPMHTDDHPPQD